MWAALTRYPVDLASGTRVICTESHYQVEWRGIFWAGLSGMELLRTN